MQIITKTWREELLIKIGNAYRALYPRKYQFFLTNLKRLRQVQKNRFGSYVDSKGREAWVSFRVPTELYLFIQRYIPDFGDTQADIHLLVSTWSDLAAAGSWKRPRSQLFSSEAWKKRESKDAVDEDQRSTDSEERKKANKKVFEKSEIVPA